MFHVFVTIIGMNRQIIVIAHNLRSSHNVGSLLRTCEGLGIGKVYLTGYTPFPATANDPRMPHLAQRVHRQITKTSLGAEQGQPWERQEDVAQVIANLKVQGFTITGLEQTPSSINIVTYRPPERIAIILGREVEGLEQSVLGQCDLALEIPMLGSKESFNVVQAAAMVLYHCRFAP
jgi:23S rRNA (guanosine2251-2'-O)-methyltransferase